MEIADQLRESDYDALVGVGEATFWTSPNTWRPASGCR